MIAIDTNILIYAHRSDSVWHAPAREAIRLVAETRRWAIPWPCLHEFFGVTTNSKIYRPSSTPEQAIVQIEVWLESPTLSLLSETTDAWVTLRDLIRASKLAGPAVHDARIAALCLQHGVTELWTADRDFSRFPALRVVNPLVPPPTRASEARASWRVAATPHRPRAKPAERPGQLR